MTDAIDPIAYFRTHGVWPPARIRSREEQQALLAASGLPAADRFWPEDFQAATT